MGWTEENYRQKVAAMEFRSSLFEMMKGMGEVNIGQMAELVNKSRDTLSNHLHALKCEGYINCNKLSKKVLIFSVKPEMMNATYSFSIPDSCPFNESNVSPKKRFDEELRAPEGGTIQVNAYTRIIGEKNISAPLRKQTATIGGGFTAMLEMA